MWPGGYSHRLDVYYDQFSTLAKMYADIYGKNAVLFVHNLGMIKELLVEPLIFLNYVR